MYKVYFKYTVVDKREEIYKIIVHELYGVPLYYKSCNYRLFKNIQEAEIFLNSTIYNIMTKLTD